MRRYIGYPTLLAIILFAGFTAHPDEVLARNAPGPEFAPDRIIVKLENQAPAGTLEVVNRKNGARTKEKLPRLRLGVVEVPEDLSVAEAVEAYENAPEI